MKNIKSLFIAFILGNISCFLGIKVLLLDESNNVNLSPQQTTAIEYRDVMVPSSTDSVLKNKLKVVNETPAVEDKYSSSLAAAQSTTPVNRHMINYLIEEKVIDENVSIDQVRQLLLDNYQDMTHEFNERLDSISMYSQLNNFKIPDDTVELLVTELENLNEAHDSDQIVQVINLLNNNISDYQLLNLSIYLNSEDPYIQASMIQTIGHADTHNEYQEQILNLWQNSSNKDVRERAYFTLKNRYKYDFVGE